MLDIRQSDAILIDRFQKGDFHAMDTLIQKHGKRAHNLALRLTQNEDVASDIVAETFVKIFRALPRFKGNSAFTTWMHRVLTNCFLDYRKKESARPHLSLDTYCVADESGVAIQIIDPSDSPHDKSEHRERLRTIQMALQKLVPHQKTMILMYHVEMLSYDDMAKVLRVPVGTVKSRMNRARVSLRSFLKDDAELFAAA